MSKTINEMIAELPIERRDWILRHWASISTTEAVIKRLRQEQGCAAWMETMSEDQFEDLCSEIALIISGPMHNEARLMADRRINEANNG